MTNPLLTAGLLPAFSKIRPEHIEPAIRKLITQSRQLVDEKLASETHYTWDNLLGPLESQADRLSRAWSPVNHLHSVADNEALREAYNACLPLLTEYGAELGQHTGLFEAYRSLREAESYAGLEQAQKQAIENALRDFRLSGVDLPAAQQAEYREVKKQLSQQQTRFEENVLDATQGWTRQIEDADLLAGLPESALSLLAQNAQREGKSGWLINLEFPSYLPVMQYADRRDLREEVYRAYVTRASDQGPGAGDWDNSDIILDILALRQKQALLLGFENYAEYSLQRKMASDTQQVLDFLADLARRSRPRAEQELKELAEFTRQHHGLEELQPWDLSYYSEKLRLHKFHLSQEELRPYFPAAKVIQGMFAVVERLYGLTIRLMDEVDSWHPDVQFYEIHDADQVLRGQFYLDLYARPRKRGGAWMDECVVRRLEGSQIQTPVAYLTCNFTPPVGGQSSLLTHDEVLTLFHEFGHGLHHMLTRVDYADVSGINGVAWDAVELPSQFMENWCWEKESLALVSGHVDSGEALPDGLFEKLRRARSFQSGMQMLRQIEFALFDFRLHARPPCRNIDEVQALLDQVRSEVAVVIPPDYNRFQHSFSHIFAGGYAAGYYSYKWAEVLSADAFSKFEENGIFDRTTGEQFLHSILEQGGSRDPMSLFVDFRGREPNIEALLKHSGILSQEPVNRA